MISGSLRLRHFAFLLGLAPNALGCDTGTTDPVSRRDPTDPVTLREAYLTDRDRSLDVDSPVAWRGGDNTVRLFATAKAGDVVLVHDAATGDLLGEVGGYGTGPGRLDRPNGIAVAGDLLLVVERENRRVQGFSLPELEPVGTFGGDVLQRPYGIAVVERSSGLDVYVTDQDERDIAVEERLATRVKRFRVTRGADGIAATLEHAFGATSGPGALPVVESIHADPARDRLLIADEQSKDINIYTLDGEFTGEEVTGYFLGEPEGIALYRCGDDGYWIATDQHDVNNTFHVFDREDLAYLGAFRGVVTRNTDGIAVLEGSIGDLAGGAFFAVHDDGNVGAFAWSAIAGALRLDDC